MKQRWGIYLIFVLAMTGCASNTKTQSTASVVPTFIPIPPTISVHSNEDISEAANVALSIQSIISVYNERNHEFKTINLSNAVIIKQKFGYMLASYSKSKQIFVVVSFPSNFQVFKYAITQVLNTYPAYSVTDPSLSAAVFRDLPTELSSYGEPETEGEACDQSVSGQLTITNKQPLQGNFQFRCQFQDGRWASVAGTFSQ